MFAISSSFTRRRTALGRFTAVVLLALSLAGCRLDTSARISFGDIAEALNGQRVEVAAELTVWAPLTADRAAEQAAQIQQALAPFLPGLRYLRFVEQRGAMENGLVFEFPAALARGEARFSRDGSPLALSLVGTEPDRHALMVQVDAQRIALARQSLAQRNPMMRVEDRQITFRLILENDTRGPVRIQTAAIFVDGRALEFEDLTIERRRSVAIELSNHASVRLLTPGAGHSVVFMQR